VRGDKNAARCPPRSDSGRRARTTGIEAGWSPAAPPASQPDTGAAGPIRREEDDPSPFKSALESGQYRGNWLMLSQFKIRDRSQGDAASLGEVGLFPAEECSGRLRLSGSDCHSLL
jgi:hypothetical protein